MRLIMRASRFMASCNADASASGEAVGTCARTMSRRSSPGMAEVAGWQFINNGVTKPNSERSQRTQPLLSSPCS